MLLAKDVLGDEVGADLGGVCIGEGDQALGQCVLGGVQCLKGRLDHGADGLRALRLAQTARVELRVVGEQRLDLVEVLEVQGP